MSFARKGGRSECKGHSARRRGELIRSGVKVAIVGPPNAGKSSLLNVLAAREAAIVSPIPGTTRDAVEVSIELEGFKVHGNIVHKCSGHVNPAGHGNAKYTNLHQSTRAGTSSYSRH